LPRSLISSLPVSPLDERCKIHDLIMEGIDTVLKKRRYPSVEDLKAGKKR
jgi:hypothetical protein